MQVNKKSTSKTTSINKKERQWNFRKYQKYVMYIREAAYQVHEQLHQ